MTVDCYRLVTPLTGEGCRGRGEKRARDKVTKGWVEIYFFEFCYRPLVDLSKIYISSQYLRNFGSELGFLSYVLAEFFSGLDTDLSLLRAGVTNLNQPLSSFLLPPIIAGYELAPSLLGPLWTTSNARWGDYLRRWSSIRRCTRLPGCIRNVNFREFW